MKLYQVIIIMTAALLVPFVIGQAIDGELFTLNLTFETERWQCRLCN